MTNLEWIVKNLDGLCMCAYIAKHGRPCRIDGAYFPYSCEDCKFNSDVEVIKALMEEHEERKQ